MNTPLTASRPRSALPAAGPQLRAVSAPDAVSCPGCARRLGGSGYRRSLRVCAWCGHHGRVPAGERARQLTDGGRLEVIDVPADLDADPIGFDDGTSYTAVLRDARERSGAREAMIIARADVGGHRVVLACMEFSFLGGSLGVIAGERFARGCEVAVAEGRPLVVVCTSGGARMQEGVAALAQMARCSVGVAAVAEAELPYISILADPCFGGVTASFAAQADVVIAEPRARIGFAGGRVVEQTSHERLPDGFQSAEFLLDHGMVDIVAARSRLRQSIGSLLSAFTTAHAIGDSLTAQPAFAQPAETAA
jgi:acetyl-CoA carboxylase carboxyl transferase subunit beta